MNMSGRNSTAKLPRSNQAFFACLLFGLLFYAQPAGAEGARLFFAGVPPHIEAGERFTVAVKVSSLSEPVNAVSGAISFPESLFRVVSISKENGIINLWIAEPAAARNRISFEGVILNPGYQGPGGTVFRIVFEAKKPGTASLGFSEGAILANDGQGTNILTALGSAGLSVVPPTTIGSAGPAPAVPALEGKQPAIPVITKYSASVEPNSMAYLRGQGEPGALTKLVFRDVALKSAGEKFISFLQGKRKIKPAEVILRNNSSGGFLYVSADNLVAGIYDITPFLIDDKNEERSGLGAQLLVKESPIVQLLVVLVNILALLVPIVALLVAIYFIPWYSFKRMRLLKKKLRFEEEKIESSEHHLEHEDEIENMNHGPESRTRAEDRL